MNHKMINKKTVRIRIESVSQGQRVDMTVPAQMNFRNGAVYYRYNEPGKEMNGTTTTVKVRSEEIKVMRHGQIRSEQSFSLGTELPGFYQLSLGPAGVQQLRLKTRTKRLHTQLVDGLGVMDWAYELDVDGELAGAYEL